MDSSLLFSNTAKSVVLLDIPRSIEEAQVLLSAQPASRRILSCEPQAKPWVTPEPKTGRASPLYQEQQNLRSPAAAIAELMTLESVRAALDEVKQEHKGPWCLPRIIPGPAVSKRDLPGEDASSHKDDNLSVDMDTEPGKEGSPLSRLDRDPLIPEASCYILGSIASQRAHFLQKAPPFELIILDPPWPSRSAKRKRKRGGDSDNSYSTAYDVDEVRDLLLQIPIASHLKPDGLVAVWITNKQAVMDLLTGRGVGAKASVFSQWGLEPVGEWTWLKITNAGDPVVDLDSQWRKSWERLLIARRPRAGATNHVPLLVPSRRTILGVPDLHSRKPNLRGLFAEVWPGGYRGLEVFARNLTAGWWAWGDDVLCFQQRRHWVVDEEGVLPEEE